MPELLRYYNCCAAIASSMQGGNSVHTCQPQLPPPLCCALPLLQADTCATFEVHGYPTMRLGLAADMAAASMDKLVEVQPASRHADSVLAWLGKQLDV